MTSELLNDPATDEPCQCGLCLTDPARLLREPKWVAPDVEPNWVPEPARPKAAGVVLAYLRIFK
jgi:hypothetical protein